MCDCFLRFLNVLDQSCEMNKNYFDVIQICRVTIVKPLSSVPVGEDNLSKEDKFICVRFRLLLFVSLQS
jgi:hypothetical protein